MREKVREKAIDEFIVRLREFRFIKPLSFLASDVHSRNIDWLELKITLATGAASYPTRAGSLLRVKGLYPGRVAVNGL